MGSPNRQLSIIKWGIVISFLFIACVIYTILSNFGLVVIACLGYFTYKKLPQIKSKLKPIAQKIDYHIEHRNSK